ncbi:MAG: hypothetical protein CMN27_10645 [Salinisphaera sp.]|nr:hypothetical protein [Salinisphaera sp.]
MFGDPVADHVRRIGTGACVEYARWRRAVAREPPCHTGTGDEQKCNGGASEGAFHDVFPTGMGFTGALLL